MRGRKRRNDIASREFDNVVHMYRKENASLKQIAHTYDVTAYVVRDLLVGMGVAIGPRGRPRAKPYVDVGTAMAAVEAIHEQPQDDNAIDLFEGFDYKATRDSVIKEVTKKQEDDNLLALGDFRRPLGQ